MKKGNSKWITVLIFLFLTFFTSMEIAEAFFLPDTGQTQCYSIKGPLKAITCPSSENAAAQDGSYTINSPLYSSISNGTIKDNNTGLTWQQQDDDIGRMWDDAVRYCDNLSLDGFTDWRLPSEKELISIMDYGRYNPSIDPIIFPNTQHSVYWSSTTTADNGDKAWTALFNFGYAYDYYSKLDTNFVRCVRGSHITFGDFTDNHNRTITDGSTGLMWQQAEAALMTWASALSYCENLSLGGYADWRLPNIKELASLSDDSKYNPAIDSLFFPSAYAS